MSIDFNVLELKRSMFNLSEARAQPETKVHVRANPVITMIKTRRTMKKSPPKFIRVCAWLDHNTNWSVDEENDRQSDVEKKHIYIDKKRDELKEISDKRKKLNPKEPLYEMDTRKDHIMTNLEVALNNADIFLKKNFFPLEYNKSDFRTSRDILYKQDGFIKESKDEILVSLKHYQQEPEHQKLAEYVAEKLNAANILMDDGKRLRVKVM